MEAAAADAGLFGPGSMTWRVMDSPVMWVAAARALYLQALHPRVMRGTWQNADFADPDQAWSRLRRTREFVLTRTFGTVAEAERAGRRVRKIHRALTGTDPDGTRFRLDEPDLLLWVHCGEVASVADVARRSGLAVDLDAFVAEQRRGAQLVGLRPAAVPASMAELGTYFEQVRPALYACEEAKLGLRLSFRPPVPSGNRGLRLALPPFNALAFATLPGWARRMYGAPGDPLTGVAATAALRTIRGTPPWAKRRLFTVAIRALRRAESQAESTAE
jgi:uncharacterized protein (DUF2236 family)